jgi:hypothetical protein
MEFSKNPNLEEFLAKMKEIMMIDSRFEIKMQQQSLIDTQIKEIRS